MNNVTNPKTDQVTAAELAVDIEIEQRQISDALIELKVNADRPDVFELQGRPLTDELAFVSRFVGFYGFHFRLLFG